MVSAVNVGSINMPKMLRHMQHRSSQVRDLTFVRDEIKQKDVKTTDAANVALSGPAVSFGYEKSSSASATAGVDTAYHTASPEIVLPGLTMLQSPIVSRRGRLESTGHRISGACKFYAPSAGYIQNLDNFGETAAFAELESYDKLYDVEKILTKVDSFTGTSATSHTLKTFADATAGYQVDRLRFTIKSSGTLTGITLNGNEGGATDATNRSLKWGGSLALSSTDYITIDVPLRDIKVNGQDGHTGSSDTTSIYKDGTRTIFTAATDNTIIDLDKLHGASTYELSSLLISLQSSASVELKDIYVYKEAEWRIESIKDYRDEYMQIAAVRVRGDRASRRRAYG